MRILAGFIAALALAACGSGGSQAPAGEKQASPLNGPALQVAQLNDLQRNGVFLKAIRDSGLPCQQVSLSERIEIRTGVTGWRAQCDDGGAHLIEILADGTAKITSRAD